MADHIWISTGSTNYAVAANWSNGVVPGGVVGDSIIFRGSRSQVSCLTNVDRSADLNYSRAITETDYRGEVGSIGTPLIINMAADPDNRIIHRGLGRMVVNPGIFTDVVVDSQNMVDAARIGGTGIRNLGIKSGTVTINASTVAAIAVAGGNARLDIDAAMLFASPGCIALFSGTINNAANVDSTTSIVVNGTFTMTGKLGNNCPVAILPNGTLLYKPATVPAAGDTPNVVVNGILDLRETSFDLSAKFKHLVIGPSGQILGMPLGLLAPTLSFTDMREEYP